MGGCGGNRDGSGGDAAVNAGYTQGRARAGAVAAIGLAPRPRTTARGTMILILTGFVFVFCAVIVLVVLAAVVWSSPPAPQDAPAPGKRAWWKRLFDAS